MASHIPHLKDISGSKQLIVHGSPFLVRGAELQNSSFSSAKYMKELWPRLVKTNLNTVLGSVTWEMIEPDEGVFDFTVIDQIILDARQNGLKLVLLWFGSWKNGMSTYVPSWVKLSPTRFPRACLRGPKSSLMSTEILSPFQLSSAEADAKAFATLMRHVKEIDEMHSTVIMVQPENECGILGDSRDRSDIADRAFHKPVPRELVDFLQKEWDELHMHLRKNLQSLQANQFRIKEDASWAEVFGDSPATDELFMAYQYALYVNIVAKAGKAEYSLPIFCNFWLNYNGDGSDNSFPALAGGGGMPGDYPSGGGVSTVLDIWMHFAKSIDFIAPDLYLNDYDTICSTYRHHGQPLFIPEQRRDEYGARRLWRAIGSYQAIGVSPFGIDSLDANEECAYTRHYELLRSISDIVLEAQQRPGAMAGFFFDEILSQTEDVYDDITLEIGGYEIHIERAFVTGRPGPGYGLIILMSDNSCSKGTRFLLVGQGFQAAFRSLDPSSHYTGILKFEEKQVNSFSGKLETLRRLNGDETRSGQFAIMPNDNPDYAGFPISITIPARTKIAECTVYHI